MKATKKKVEYSKKLVGGVTIGLFTLLLVSLVLISFAGLQPFQAESVVTIIQGVTTQTGVAITNYSVKAGVENTSKIRKAYQEAESLMESGNNEDDQDSEDAIG